MHQLMKPSNATNLQNHKGSPTLVFLPFSEDLLRVSERNHGCWEPKQTRQTNGLSKANYPCSSTSANGDEERADRNSLQTSMTLVPYTQQAMSVSVLRGGQWEAL
jgi:hypothetical protein